MIFPCKYFDKILKQYEESFLCLSGRKLLNRRMLTNNQSQLRYQINHQLCIDTKCCVDGNLPFFKAFFWFTEQFINKIAECSRKCEVSIILFELLKFTMDQVSPFFCNDPVQFIHQYCFSHTGITRHQAKLYRAVGRIIE